MATPNPDTPPPTPRSRKSELSTPDENTLVVYVQTVPHKRHVPAGGRKPDAVAEGYRVGVKLGTPTGEEGVFLNKQLNENDSRVRYEAFGHLKAVEFACDYLGTYTNIRKIIIRTEFPIGIPSDETKKGSLYPMREVPELKGDKAAQYLWAAMNRQAKPRGIQVFYEQITHNQNIARPVAADETRSVYYTAQNMAQYQAQKEEQGVRTQSPILQPPSRQLQEPAGESPSSEIDQLRKQVESLTEQVAELAELVRSKITSGEKPQL